MKTASVPAITPDARMLLARAPERLRRYQGAECDVLDTRGDGGGNQFSYVRLPDGRVEWVACVYLAPIPLAKAPRRGPLDLKPDKDTRSEAERMDEGVAFLRKRDYMVLRVGQGKVSAVCHKCSRENGKLTPIRCKACGSRGFSPSTNSTEGTPDTFISHPEWPCLWFPMEWKDGPHGERTKEQKELEKAGRIVVAWNLESCLSRLVEFERATLGRKSHPEIIAYLAARSER